MSNNMSLFTHWAFNWDDVQHMLPKGAGLCLDLGCGDGRHRDWVDAAGWTWIGLDIDVKRGGAKINGNAEGLPFANESFRLVLLWQVLEHFPHPWVVLSEVNRVLKPGSFVYGSVSCLEPFHDVCSYYGFTYRGIEQILTDCGFTNIQLQSGLNAFALIARGWLRRLLKPKQAERLAFGMIKLGLLASTEAILWLRKVTSILRRGAVSKDYERTIAWLAGESALQFAGHIQFLARKGEDL